MANGSWFETLALMDKAQRDSIINEAYDDLGKLIMNIASDIYDSCIKLYYATYKPVMYKRHGKIEGRNLYFANELMYDEVADVLKFHTNEYKLLPYKGGFDEEEYGAHYEDKRELILHLVMAGQRGSKTRFAKHTKSWPKSWKAIYPNKFSKYNRWSSNERTMYTIFDDFMDQIEDGSDTMLDWLDEILASKVK